MDFTEDELSLLVTALKDYYTVVRQVRARSINDRQSNEHKRELDRTSNLLRRLQEVHALQYPAR